jgi:hypothetical protein
MRQGYSGLGIGMKKQEKLNTSYITVLLKFGTLGIAFGIMFFQLIIPSFISPMKQYGLELKNIEILVDKNSQNDLKKYIDESITNKTLDLLENQDFSNTENGAIYKVKISNIEKEIETLKSMTIGLRQAISPGNPEEILTIARLEDRIISLEDSYSNLGSQIQERQEYRYQAVLREMSVFKWVLSLVLAGILIPMLGNGINYLRVSAKK